jgi:CheY-like chemotaxis protein
MDSINNKLEQEQVRIIIVDDDQLTILLTTKILLNYDSTLKVDHFNSGKAAIEYVKNNEISASTIILLDIDMPLYNGWDFLEEFTKLTTIGKVFMFSSSIDIRDIERSKQYKKVLGFISKPLNAQKIQSFLADAFL